MSFRFCSAVFLFVSLPLHAADAQFEGDYLYKVSTVRAATGSMPELLDWIAAVKKSGYYKEAGVSEPLVMRHSQGDQWDLMFVIPMQSFASWYTEPAIARRASAAKKNADLLARSGDLVAFEEDVFAYGPPLNVLRSAYDDNGLYHIEMFNAAPGMIAKLTEQRRMENHYLAATGQTQNMIFRRAGGSDVDVFTIGFHKSLASFAAPADASDEDKEAAAKAAGFKDRADLSFYLRSLISSHHDTLATKEN